LGRLLAAATEDTAAKHDHAHDGETDSHDETDADSHKEEAGHGGLNDRDKEKGHDESAEKGSAKSTKHDESAEHDAHEGEKPDAHAGESHEGETEAEHKAHEGEADEHGHAAKQAFDHKHSEADAIKLGEQARKNIGVRLVKVELRSFVRTITVPGVVVERPGWSTLDVTSSMTGMVSRIYPIQGQSVRPGQPLFEVRLTHEDLLQKQTEFLRSIEELDVVLREVARLEKVTADGAIAGKTLLERKYEQQKLEASLRAQRQALLLHGLSKEQVAGIETNRSLLQSLTVYAPTTENGVDATKLPEDGHASSSQNDAKTAKEPVAGATGRHKTFRVQEIKVSQGAYVTAGTLLCRLVDHGDLYIEGKAFEQDVQAINDVAAQGLRVAASVESKTSGSTATVSDLKILYLDDRVHADTRAFCFYVALPNRVLREEKGSDGRDFLYWQFKPGQRMQIKVPVETWANRIVLPHGAVAQEGAEFYVFEANGDHFDRRPIHVEYRDADWVVIANDGAIKLGVMVDTSAAHQIQMAIKNKSGGAIDPHAGHNH
jgi:biotin carboxyl carrier protein